MEADGCRLTAGEHYNINRFLGGLQETICRQIDRQIKSETGDENINLLLKR